jgi:hypothetical protein
MSRFAPQRKLAARWASLHAPHGVLRFLPFRGSGRAAVLGAFVAACGPGLESVHESNLRFEHCYRLDMDPRIAPSHREYCWRDWNQTYASDQPLDRIEYARRRILTLESGDSRLVSVKQQSFGGGRVFEEVGVSASPSERMAAPAPTSAHAPPPKTEPAPVLPEPVVPRPGDTCASDCNGTFAQCTGPCDATKPECQHCNEDYRSCMRRCFE